MAEKLERTRTPDILQGADNASNAVANVLSFTLGQKIQQENARRQLAAVEQEQEFRKQLQNQERQAAMQRFQSDIAYRNVADQRAKELEDKKLEEIIRHNKAIEAKEGDKVRALSLLREAQANKYKEDAKVESLSKSIDERVRQLNALAPYIKTGDQSALMRSRMILQELRPLQAELDRIRSGGEASANLGGQLKSAERTGFRDYVKNYVREPITTSQSRLEEVKRKVAGSDMSKTSATPTDTTGKSLENMTIEELVKGFTQ